MSRPEPNNSSISARTASVDDTRADTGVVSFVSRGLVEGTYARAAVAMGRHPRQAIRS